MLPLPTAWTYETGLPPETGSQGFWTAQSQLAIEQEGVQFIPPHPSGGSEEPVSVAGCYTSTSGSTDGPEGPECGSRSGTKLAGQDVEDPGTCLRHRAKG